MTFSKSRLYRVGYPLFKILIPRPENKPVYHNVTLFQGLVHNFFLQQGTVVLKQCIDVLKFAFKKESYKSFLR